MPELTENSTDNHFAYLQNAYSEVGDLTWLGTDFIESNIDTSRSLYTSDSLAERQPRTKELEVYALVSGLSFNSDFTDKLVEVQDRISTVLGKSLYYWVEPDNFGVEYCVFKWPTDIWDNSRLEKIKETISKIRKPVFQFNIGGIQINPDGCVIAKGFDEGAVLFQIREQLKTDLPFLPKKQSGWAHVPMGRILEPVGAEKFTMLNQTIKSMSEYKIATTTIDIMRLIHERRWYMEEKTILAEYPLNNVVNG